MKIGHPILWIVLFESARSSEEYAPVVPYFPTTPFLHLFDPDLVPTLRPIWWCLHLPTDYGQCYDMSASELVSFEELDIPHQVLLLPINLLRTTTDKFRAPPNVALVVSPDSAISDATQLAQDWGSAFGVVSYSALTQESLDEYWRRVADLVGERAVRRLALPLLPVTLCSPERLSLLHRVRQFDPPTVRTENRADRSQSELIGEALSINHHARVLASLESTGCPPEALDARYDAERRLVRPSWHLVVGAPGAPSTIRKLAASKKNQPPPGVTSASVEDERQAIDILVAHRSIARSGFGMRLPDIPADAFATLRDVERSLRSPRANHRKTRSALNRIGKILGEALTPEQSFAFRSSRTITAFTDFPWGLTILRGDTSPICTCAPITYRPLTPLSRAVQHELTGPGSAYWGDGFSVLIAECIEETDRLRDFSEHGWRYQANKLVERGEGKVKCRFELIGSLADLHRVLDESSYDVLVLSAHGISTDRASGLRIGKDNVFDFAHKLPSVVIFSACEVWPRGSGVVSIADLALRWGAMAILGTLFPVSAQHNAFVVTRIFLYITESILRREPHLTLADAVTRALSLNAVIDVLHGSPRMRKWGFSPGTNGQLPPQVEFMLHRAEGRLRTGHVYEDTERLLLEIAEERDPAEANYAREFFRNESYTPESLFYVMIGWPENVVLQPRVRGEEEVRRSITGSH
ncbi:hypothetical protein [Sorangium sp. So ce861]|uniref:hypothetical protein n=1 Tax=Sorangium sp. So ce861 TaxID=3133323 RepID=UPI003F6463F7